MFRKFKLDYVIDMEVATGKTKSDDDAKKCFQQDFIVKCVEYGVK